jgi:hypothetical protein
MYLPRSTHRWSKLCSALLVTLRLTQSPQLHSSPLSYQSKLASSASLHAPTLEVYLELTFLQNLTRFLVNTITAHRNTIILDVSGRKFRTTTSVLSVSPYFESLFARWKDCVDLQEDRSYYVDADPDIFEHLLNFMRRPSRFPLYWTKQDGFDYVLYSKLEAEADYYMLEALREWIKVKRYLGALRVLQRKETDNNCGYPSDGGNMIDAVLQNFVVKDKLITLRTGIYFEPTVLINTKV